MWNESDRDDSSLERLSALVDGELGGQFADQACAHWRETAESRAAWHAYHLIGDVLRSDDLACHPSRDIGFLVSLRARLDQEPVVLAPRPLQPLPRSVDERMAEGSAFAVASPRRRHTWAASAAVAAGFLAVAGALTLTRPGAPPGSAPANLAVRAASRADDSTSLASTQTPMGGPQAVSIERGQQAVEPQGLVATGQVIRDARLDRYLAAHQQFAGSSALGVPSAYLRNAAVEVPGR